MSDLFGSDYHGRKAIPIFEGVLMYFPKALGAVAEVSHAGNAQHNPGEPLHWARGKSMDQYNTAIRHMMDHRMGGGRRMGDSNNSNNGWLKEIHDKDGVWHLAKAAWRVLAALELAIEEQEQEATAPAPAPATAPASPKMLSTEHYGAHENRPGPTQQRVLISKTCQCGRKRFEWGVGELVPTVVYPGEGTHSPNGCGPNV